jgi:transcriptional regulator with PAS, ATPase and Fis domain
VKDVGKEVVREVAKEVVLVLSDFGRPEATARSSAIAWVRDREAAIDRLRSGGTSAICVDRSAIGSTLADVRWLRRIRCRVPIVAMVDLEGLARAGELIQEGVEEVILREPSAVETLRSRFDHIARRRARTREPRGIDRLVARSPAMRGCLERVAKAQKSRANVLLLGETGTGKEVLARAIHEGGPRANGPFVAINCAAFPETLLESELFGCERGAFTGATRSRAGHFVSASGGTLFLDEIGETSLGFQVKLLRALQEGTVRPLGSTEEVRVDVRILAATNRDLEHEVETGRFRRDLYYRLNVLSIAIPPLRARSEDIVPLVLHFLRASPDADAPRTVSIEAAHLLEAYPWPGNVRELENEVERIVANAVGESEVTACMLSPQLRGQVQALPPGDGSETLAETMGRFEAWVLRRALDRHEGRRIATARSLGITRECLYKKLRRHGLQ